VDDPEAVRPGITRHRGSPRIECERLEAACPIVQIFPSRFRFVYMRIDVYAKHGSSLRAHRVTAVLVFQDPPLIWDINLWKVVLCAAQDVFWLTAPGLHLVDRVAAGSTMH